MKRILQLLLLAAMTWPTFMNAQSVAREWNEELLEAIRKDVPRPTVHSRNLFHSSVLMYDAWALFDDNASMMFLGEEFNGYDVPFDGIDDPIDIEEARAELLSFAVFRLLEHRFANSPNADITIPALEAQMAEFSYDESFTSTDYSGGSYAALGNYMAEQMIAYGLQDGANEANDYVNMNYMPTNDPIILPLDIVNTDIDPNRWQPLAFDYSEVDGEIIPEAAPPFLSPYWGQVGAFALNDDDLEVFEINGADFSVYHNPGAPYYIENSDGDALEDPYKWMHSLVASWSSHLDPGDGVMIDISPASIGNIQSYPTDFEGYQAFYDYENGGDASIGHDVNPATGMAYEGQMVPRADYARVLAEFWADGPSSETPPGHWFTILNHVSDNPLLEKKFQGSGDLLSDLEWDVKTYVTLGSAMHDVAVSVWGVKCYYDYVRPISAIRYMGNLGQSSDNTLDNYDPHGLPLIPGQFEIIESGDPLAGEEDEHVGEMKIMSWKGHDAIENVETDVAGVGWIRANTWIPYQKFNFVTPPFAGYVSGHSTFSSAAAEVMASVTGDEFFPGGMGTFSFAQNEYLAFEDGPSIDMELQWATYKDASDQASLSRIWGGIHPPIDDIPGRLMGTEIAEDVIDLAVEYFNGSPVGVEESDLAFELEAYPNPTDGEVNISINKSGLYTINLYSIEGKRMTQETKYVSNGKILLNYSNFESGIYFVEVQDQVNNQKKSFKFILN